MRPLSTLLVLLTALIGLFPTAKAGPLVAPAPASKPGLQMSLVTSLSRFVIPDGNTTVNTALKRPRVPLAKDSFAASVVLTNLGRSPVVLAYPGDAAAGPFQFSLLNVSGEVVWTSSAAPTAGADGADSPEPVPFTLPPRATLRRTLQVPLKTADGQWLPEGRYTVRAETGQGEALAQVPIDLVAPTPAGTGLQGQVLFLDLSFKVNTTTGADPFNSVHSTESGVIVVIGNPVVPRLPVPIQATVSISEIREPNAKYDHPAFEWSGPTDSTGHFKVATPPGRFHLSAHAKNVKEPNYLLPNWLTVNVTAGQFTTQNFVILGTLRKDTSLILSVGSATVEPLGDPVFALRIKASGQVSSAGWTEPRLVQRESSQPGVLDLDFVAVPPSGLAATVVTPIEAHTVIANSGPWTAVRVRASNGKVTASPVTPPQ